MVSIRSCPPQALQHEISLSNSQDSRLAQTESLYLLFYFPSFHTEIRMLYVLLCTSVLLCAYLQTVYIVYHIVLQCITQHPSQSNCLCQGLDHAESRTLVALSSYSTDLVRWPKPTADLVGFVGVIYPITINEWCIIVYSILTHTIDQWITWIKVANWTTEERAVSKQTLSLPALFQYVPILSNDHGSSQPAFPLTRWNAASEHEFNWCSLKTPRRLTKSCLRTLQNSLRKKQWHCQVNATSKQTFDRWNGKDSGKSM